MQKMLVPSNCPSVLINLVEAYNKLVDQPGKDIDKLFHLQKILYVMQGFPPKPEIISWRNQLGESGLEHHLQHYGISRDGSQLLQSVEFANAVRHYVLPDLKAKEQSLYKSMRERDDLLKNEKTTAEEGREAYIQTNLAIKKKFDEDAKLQDKVLRSKEFLALSYAKMDAIQGLVEQDFNEYQTRVLSKTQVNNKNFFFTIGDGDEAAQVVIRVEDRNTLGREQVLQSDEVSQYFSEDYITIMVPFKEEDTIAYQPVVVSEFVKEGSLFHYAAKLADKKPDEKIEKVQHFFEKLNDFCLKLMKSGHYHPDIKLANFLTDGVTIILSDRKTITDKAKPKVKDINSSPVYGAPEYQQCLMKDENGVTILNNVKAAQIALDMPSYMSFQLGMALKEFIFISKMIPCDVEDLLRWQPSVQNMKNPGNELKNLTVLVYELTRAEHKDRLKIEHFQTLLKKLDLPQEQFMIQLESLSPEEILTTHADMTALNRALISKDVTNKLMTIENIQKIFQDPRFKVNLTDIVSVNEVAQVTAYLQQLDTQLLIEDLKKASIGSLFLHYIGYARVPRVSSIADLGEKAPKIDEKIQAYMKIMTAAGFDKFKDINPVQQGLIQQCIQPAKEVKSIGQKMSPLLSPTENDANEAPEPSGSFVVKDKPTSGAEPAPKGTLVVKDKPSPEAEPEPAGTLVVKDKPTSEAEPESSGSLVVKSTTSVKQTVDAPPAAADYAMALNKSNVQQQVTTQQEAADISTTIERGNKGIKAKLKDVKADDAEPPTSTHTPS